jgi:protein-disulfide isomerase
MKIMQKDNIITILTSVIASVVVTVALCSIICGGKGSVDQKDVNKAIETYLSEKPEVVREALVAAEQKEQIEAQKRVAEAYKANLKELNNAEDTPFVGPKDAKVTIVEFFDFNCGYCKRLAPEMMKVIKANPDVKFVFKPVTFLGSMPTAKAALAAGKEGKFIEVYEALLTYNGQVTPEVVAEKVKAAGLDAEKIKKASESDEISKTLSKVAELSQKIGIRGVPTLIINGEPLQAVDQNGIQAAIDRVK